MKRIGNLYHLVYDMDNLKRAHQNAKKGKGWYKEVKMVDSDPDKYLGRIQRMLMFKTYHTSEYKIFDRYEGRKLRHIHKLPYYPDRIVHWAIIQVIEAYFLKTFTADTYSSIPKRGIHYGMRRVQNDLELDPEGCKYCLKFDISKFYESINHDILKNILQTKFKDKDLLWLIGEIIDSIPKEEGLPIGNYLSQYCANLYLSGLDHWIKEEKRVKYYHRYMDDVVIMSQSKIKLRSLFYDIKSYITDTLKLKIKQNYQIFPTFIRGIDFLGFRFFGSHTLLRKNTKQNMKRKLFKIFKRPYLSLSDRCSISSYSGWTMYADCRNLEHKVIAPLIYKFKMEGA